MSKTSVNEIPETNTIYGFTYIPDVENCVINEDDAVSMDSRFKAESLIMRSAIEGLVRRVENIERASSVTDITFGKKMCPTRHGCTGATNCNYDYASYPG